MHKYSSPPDYQLSSQVDFSRMKTEGMEEFMVLSRLSKKVREKLKLFQAGDLSKYDKYFDFYELDMACPTEGDENSDSGKQQLGLNTDYEKPDYRIIELQECDKILSLMRSFLDSKPDIEEAVRRSLHITPYNDTVENQLLTALSSVLSLDDVYMTNEVIKANAEVITLAFGNEGMEMVEEVSAGVSDKANGALNEEKAATEAKKYDLTTEEFLDAEAGVVTIDPEELPFN